MTAPVIVARPICASRGENRPASRRHQIALIAARRRAHDLQQVRRGRRIGPFGQCAHGSFLNFRVGIIQPGAYRGERFLPADCAKNPSTRFCAGCAPDNAPMICSVADAGTSARAGRTNAAASPSRSCASVGAATVLSNWHFGRSAQLAQSLECA
jgi:hypothetical protein